jgi:hypothetical protein
MQLADKAIDQSQKDLESEKRALEKRINETIGYLFLMKEDRTLTKQERAMIDMCLNYLRG